MAYKAVLLNDCSIWLFFFRIKAPINEKIMCVIALNTITIGKPATKKPSVDTDATKAATVGEINIAIITGTWLAKVNDAGSSLILGNVNGINIPKAHRSADTVIIFTLFIFIILITLPY
jgi:hypothetical protein